MVQNRWRKNSDLSQRKIENNIFIGNETRIEVISMPVPCGPEPYGFAIPLANIGGWMRFRPDEIRKAFLMTPPDRGRLYEVFFKPCEQSPFYRELPLEHAMLYVVQDLLETYREIEDAVTALGAKQ